MQHFGRRDRRATRQELTVEEMKYDPALTINEDCRRVWRTGQTYSYSAISRNQSAVHELLKPGLYTMLRASSSGT